MLIGVDWGTSRLRAYLVSDDGTVIDRTESEAGLMRVGEGGFEPALAAAVGPWRAAHPDAPIVMSGMVGSRQGWVEAPYVATPADLDAIAAAVIAVPTDGLGDVVIVPGVAIGIAGDTFADVMRGEEAEVFGALDALGRDDGLFILPGTHSKWVTVEAGAITGFHTYMTGDVYAALAGHTILSKMFGTDPGDGAGFARGLDAARGMSAPGDLLNRLFAIRAEGLMGRLADDDVPGFLSGLLIGAEVASAAADAREAFVIGASDLAGRYHDALAAFGVAAITVPSESATRCHARIARARAR
ncbi:2-dehydro-3-deoxygalactonokinase [Acuticoccus mangrovi]|uniref:2-dehydro-3-deoxygalactonokinase n=1 Tax=Acuticoccus mangrovi TaxID=2796142 RepID=A0A934MHY3_9HYPH|nr:2-dehydro-3-deoxygalactonokinase [Acuticoccus mangrovi]MBJ3777385.1 2-dehydro-3-deoxygalactonokinase [Acuticoccus mangrovi]